MSELGPAVAAGTSRRRPRLLPVGWRGLLPGRDVVEVAPPVVGPPEVAPLLPSEEWFCGRVRHLAHTYRESGVSDPVLGAVLDAVREGWSVPEPLLRTLWMQAGQGPAGRVW